MAENNNNPGAITNTFNKGMLKDYNETFIGEGLYTHARNAVNNTHDGQLGVIGNEPANLHCVNLPYPLIGAVHLIDDQWALFLTDDKDSEIGIFDESACTYVKKIRSQCLNFKLSHPITGISRRRFDCERPVYFVDALNPDRFIDLDNIPYKYTETFVNECSVKVFSDELDCEKLRLIPLVQHPCLVLRKGKMSGSLYNGSYQVALAYLINGVRVTDYMGISEVQGLFTHENGNSSLEVDITKIDTNFDEFQLVLISNINQQNTVRRLGVYNTSIGTIFIDRIDLEQPAIAISEIVFRTDQVEKSDAIYTVNDYALRIGAYTKYKFNYQLQASRIVTRWTSVKYPADFYHKGGNNTSYMRDEVYSFFIRWVYNTGDRSDSYHIPGRNPTPEDREFVFNSDNYDGSELEKWQVYNTATIEQLLNQPTVDGGLITATGKMGYWESTEKYPDDRRDIWGELCGKKIRHHKIPDETVNPILNHFAEQGTSIVLLGVEFDNIEHPLDQNGNPITSIVGYEILRGSREGNKSIIAKGIINNMREYDIPNSQTMGLYQNYPFNDLDADTLLTSDPNIIFTDQPATLNNDLDDLPNVNDDILQVADDEAIADNVETTKEDRKKIKKRLKEERDKLQDARDKNIDANLNSPLTVYKKDYVSFHSPDVSFSNPFLSVDELKLYQEVSGKSLGFFEHPYKHPKFKTVTNFSSIFASVISSLSAIGNILSIFGNDANITLPGSNELSYEKKLTLQKVTNFPVTVGGTVLGTGASVSIPQPVNLATNAIISVFNGTMAVVMSALEAQAIGEQILNVIYGMIPAVQNAVQYNAHGFYNDSPLPKEVGFQRYKVDKALYVGTGTYAFDEKYNINNVNRNRFVTLKLNRDVNNPTVVDKSRFRINQANNRLNVKVSSTISSHYGSLKINFPSQYGQLDSIKQLVISGGCIHPAPIIGKYRSGLLWGGDTYINRFTEKNTMYFFDTWLMGEPNGFEFDYRNHMSIAYPRFWINSNRSAFKLFRRASNNRHLDQRFSDVFFVSQGYFYLFYSGVRDFFVESEINLAYRDWEEDTGRRHYDPYGFSGDENLRSIFRSDIIRNGNYYKYDYSLSVAKMFSSSITWGSLLPRDYNPVVAAKCYTYYPDRVLYSLPQQLENKKDHWRLWLVNNYKDFPSPITSIKPINRSGALFMMKRQSPMQFVGVEEIKFDGTGAKITIGDGQLFQQDMKAVISTDDSFEYGSCQNRLATLNCTHGVFWVSQNQGKVFQFVGSIKEISRNGMKWWFAKNLPSKLLEAFPNYPYQDNTVIGVGVLMTYDNVNEIIYITKRDFKPKDSRLLCDGKGVYFLNAGGKVYVDVFDSNYFEDASWTISYDPKSETWISFHDWKPNYLLPSKRHFLSVKNKGIWKHNLRCDLFCNFYGVDYPFEIEFVSATGQMVNSMRNIEYLLECYQYHNDCQDRFHVLDGNFDQAMIYNSEQLSGMLELFIKSKNNPLNHLTFPQVGASSIKINYSKEEQKYRFNQFWDITKNRGEFQSVNVPMFITAVNGYEYTINPAFVDYEKPVLERKKFRHNVNRVWVRKLSSGNIKMLFKISNQKILNSPR
jgi:ElaB/YqjD/DUF883 family membrane-anchored ribosome-binding protein